MIIRAKSPLRVSFSGGGTDISPYLDEFGGCVLSTTINKYVYSSLTPRTDREIIINSHDYNVTVKYNLEDEINDDLRLVKSVIKRLNISKGFEISIKSDAPSGSGLGSSSALVVCLVGLFQKWLNLPLTHYDIASLSYDIERNDMGIKGGYQDQYASAFGGFNYIEFQKSGVIVNSLKIKRDYLNELEYNLVLCYTGQTRLGDKIIEKQVSGYDKNIAYLHQLKNLTIDMKNYLLTGKLDEFGNLFKYAWENKKRLSSSISNPYIDELYEVGIKNGAMGGKLLGAGGGGYLLFYCQDKIKVAEALQKAGGQIVDFNFDYKGVQTWKI